jgi:hypothetical protein
VYYGGKKLLQKTGLLKKGPAEPDVGQELANLNTFLRADEPRQIAELASRGENIDSLEEITEAQSRVIAEQDRTIAQQERIIQDQAGDIDTLKEICANAAAAIQYQSFPRNTLVAVRRGDKPIQDIRVGDRVWGYSDTVRRPQLYPVIRLHRRTAPGVLRISVGDQIIKVTAEHPFNVRGHGWVKARNLKPGDWLVTLRGPARLVRKIDAAPGAVEVFNFDVAKAHSYYVSKSKALVHNAEGTCSEAGNETVGSKSAEESSADLSGEASVDDVAGDVFGDAVEASADVGAGAAEAGVDMAGATVAEAGADVVGAAAAGTSADAAADLLFLLPLLLL